MSSEEETQVGQVAVCQVKAVIPQRVDALYDTPCRTVDSSSIRASRT